MRIHRASVRDYDLFVFPLVTHCTWRIWRDGSWIAKGVGTESIAETKLIAQNHLHKALMNRTERKGFDPAILLDWKELDPAKEGEQRAKAKKRKNAG